MKNLLFSLLLFIGMLSQVESIAQRDRNQNPIESEKENPFNFVYDRFGNKFTLDEIRIPDNSEIAGIFRLHFIDDDQNIGSGYDGSPTSIGGKRRKVLVQVFEDITELIGGFTQNPYTNLTYSCLNPSDEFPDCRKVEIEIALTNTSNSGAYASATPYIMDAGNGIAFNQIWKYINTGFDPYHRIPTGPFGPGSPIPSTNASYYHGRINTFWGNHNWNLELNSAAGTGEVDLYSVMLHEALHMLGLYSFISSSGQSLATGTNPGFYSAWDTYLETSTGTSLMGYDLDNDCWDAEVNTSIIPNINGSCPGINFVGPGGTPTNTVYSSNPYSTGSSLSHFNCTQVTGHALNPGITTGYNQRYPHLNEVQALCAIGYQVTQTYGAGTPGVTLFPAAGSTYTYTTNTCATPRPVAGTNDFRPWTADNGDMGGNTWDNSSDYTIFAGDNITFGNSTNNVFANDFNAFFFGCEPEIIVGDGSITGWSGPTDMNFTYQSGGTFAGTAVIKYRPRNWSGQMGNMTYIFIKVLANPLAYCDPAVSCGDNLVCYGDFEDIVFNLIQPLSTNTGRCDPGSGNNSPDLYWDDNGTMYGQYNASWLWEYNCASDPFPVPFPNTSVNPTNLQYMGIGGFHSNVESVVFPLKQPLVSGGNYQISFWGASGCEPTVNFVFSADPPCTNNMVEPQPGSTIVCSNSNPYTNLEHETINMSNTLSGGNLQWAYYSTTFTASSNGSQYLLVHLDTGRSNINYAIYPLLDDIELIRLDPDSITISSNAGIASPCIGDTFSIEYEVCNPGLSTLQPPIQFQATFQNGLTIVPNSDFNSNGITTINSSISPSGCVTLTLDLILNTLAIPGSPQIVEFTVLGGACINNSTQLVDTIYAGTDQLTISKTAINGPYFTAGDPILYEIEVCNNSIQHQISNIVIQDIMDNNHVVTVAQSYWNVTGNTFTTAVPFSLSPGQCTTFTAFATIDSNFSCGEITNCASIISANGACNLPLDTCIETMVYGNYPPPPIAGTDTCYCYGDPMVSMTATGVFNSTGLYWYIGSIAAGNAIGFGPTMFPTMTAPGTYHYLVFDTYNGCLGLPDTVTICIHPRPDATISAPMDTICLPDDTMQLTGATPGGTWSSTTPGAVSSTGVFDPNAAGVGSHQVYYSVPDPNDLCDGIDSLIITVLDSTAPVITSPYTSICNLTGPFQLTAQPTGGNWSGSGVNASGWFDPSLVSSWPAIITYSLNSGSLCETFDQVTIDMDPADWQQVAGTDNPNIKEEGNDVVVDNTGNIYITGKCAPGILFGTSTTILDIGFIASYDECGNLRWAHGLGNKVGLALELDNSHQRVFVTGHGPNVSGPFIQSWDVNGSLQFTAPVNTNTPNLASKGTNIDVDAFGNIYIVGQFNYTNPSPGILTFPGWGSISSTNLTSGFIAKFNPNSQQWLNAKPMLGNSPSDWVSPKGICISPNGNNIYVCGEFNNFANLLPITLTGGGSFVVDYHSSLSTLNANTFGAMPMAHSIQYNFNNNQLYMVGGNKKIRIMPNLTSIGSPFSMGPNLIYTSIYYDQNSGKIYATGKENAASNVFTENVNENLLSPNWTVATTTANPGSTSLGLGVATNGNGYIYTVGIYIGDIQFGGTSSHNSYAGTQDLFLSRIREVGLTAAFAKLKPKPKGEEITNALQIYPNPNQGTFTILISNEMKEESNDVVILDMLGKVVFERKSVKAEEFPLEVNLENRANGIYLVQLKNGPEVYQQKVVKR